ncbi:MAG: hypothetical protein MJ063_06360 [Lachnospiraceae bacterium]|nr:hypothetical protein [Lachnospiraceae bacterium]
MSKLKIGFLPLYIKMYDDSNPASRIPREAYANVLADMLESQGLELVKADVCRTAEEFSKAANMFNNEDVSAVVTYHLAYSPSLESIQALLSIAAPIIVLDTTPDYELIETAEYSNRIGMNHGIHGVQDMCTLLKRNHRAFNLCVGHAFHSEVISEVIGMCRAAAVVKSFRNIKIGSVGGAFYGMGDFQIPDDRIKRDIGAEIAYMTPEEAERYVARVTDKEVEDEIRSDKKKYDVQVTDTENYKASTRSGLAVRKWMNDNDLGACTINFLSLDKYNLPKMPFVECCKILERRQGYAGEGDVLTAGLVGALLSVYPNTTFTEMFCPDWKENVILLSHMAESNPNLGSWQPLITDKKFTINKCGNTTGMYNCYRKGKVIYINLAPMDDSYTLIVTEGEMLDCGLRYGAYAKATQGWFKTCKPLKEFLREYSLAGGTHHSAMIYDADIEEIKAFGSMMGFNVVEIK